MESLARDRAALDAALASELTRRYSASDEDLSLDDAMACLAEWAWKRAEELIDPREDETEARKRIGSALQFAAQQRAEHLEARRIFERFLETPRRLLSHPTDRRTSRLHRTCYLMATQLFDTSIYDPTLRCSAGCEPPEQAPPGWCCPTADDGSSAACARSLVFPFLHLAPTAQGTDDGAMCLNNIGKAAQAIVRGLKRLRELHPSDPELTVPTEHAVRQAIKRFDTKQDALRSRFHL